MRVTDLWRYPIKAHGRERLEDVTLIAGHTLPFDRLWAVAHEASQLDWETGDWAHCANFSRAAKAPQIHAITAKLDETTRHVTLSHPARPDFTFSPDTPDEEAAFLDWVRPLCPADRAAPTRLYRSRGRGITDSQFPSVSINSHASRRSLSEKAGTDVSADRFRGNIWIDGLAPWAEFDWIGQDIKIGAATLRVKERTERCKAILANPRTGERDLDTLGILEREWGHTDFGVLAEVIEGGPVATQDEASL